MGALLLAAVLALLVGAVLGLLGGGGGILAVPMLVYAVGVGAKPAIATSLVLVGTTSLVGTLLRARTGQVRWKLGVVFGAGSMPGAFAGGRLAELVPEQVLLVGLAAVMLTTATFMLRGRSERAEPSRRVAVGKVLAIGVGVGVVSGLVGAGGGFLIVPALTLFGGLAMHEAIATSLFVIAVQSFAGFAGHLGHVEIDGRLVLATTGAAVVGMALGSRLSTRVRAASLRRAFAFLLFATALFVVGRQLPLPWTAVVAVVALSVALVVARRASSARAELEKETCPSPIPSRP